MGRNDLMTTLLDTRRALEEKVAALGERVDASRQEVTEAVTAQVSDLHADNRETRTRVDRTASSLSEVNKSLPVLRQDVTDLSRDVRELRDLMGKLLNRLPDASSTSPSPGRANSGPASGQTLPEHPGQDTTASTPTPQGPAAVPHAEAAGPSPRTEADVLSVAAERLAAAHPGRQQPLPDPDGDGPGDGSPAGPDAAESGDSDPGSESLVQHDLVLASAATVGTVHLVCHRDLWDFVQEHAADIAHFRAPAAPSEEGQDRVRITLSGRSVIGVLTAMRTTRTNSAPYGKDDGTWALSYAVYDRLARDLTTTGRTGTRPLTVVFDDGITSDDTP
ncbi:hypothetical protein [Streptomyces sp. SID1121]|uniref:hypothetical protein n=1 Tax=Streptomyces sp. SID1121 TaxID=3425888 RepID=UPI0040563AF5